MLDFEPSILLACTSSTSNYRVFRIKNQIFQTFFFEKTTFKQRVSINTYLMIMLFQGVQRRYYNFFG